MFVNTRYDKLDLSLLGLAGSRTTQGFPITVSGEQLMRAGSKFYVNGHHLSSQVFGSSWGVDTRAEVDTHLNALASAGVNMIGMMGFESSGRVHSGPQAGRQIGCFELGYQFSGLTGRNWAIGERCWTIDGSGIRRVYECITSGVGSGTTGPTGAGSDITNGATHWKFLHVAGSVYSEEFFAGSVSLGSAGFDYFMDACGRRGIYVTLRFNVWDLVISGQTGYPLNGGGNLNAMFGVWPFDGEYGTPTVRTYMRNHIAHFLDRVNTVNGKRYGDDHTLAVINPWNEMGLAYWFYNSTSTTSPSGNTFDRMCFQGSSTSAVDLTNPTALYVAAWDSKFAAWYAATFGTTPASDYGKLNTLPCDGYTGAMGANVAARNDYRSGVTGNDYAWRKRVNRFLRETEATMVGDMQTWLRTKSGHVLQLPGQSSWMFHTSMSYGNICGFHLYISGTDTSSNTNTVTATTAPTAGMAYTAAAGGTITFTGMPSADTTAHPLVVGAWIRWTLTSNPSITGVAQIATTGDPWTVTGVGADPGIGGTNVNCSVVIGTADKTACDWHNEPPVDTSTTRTHVWMAGGSGESNADAAGWSGNANYGNLTTLRSPQRKGMPKLTTEFGNRAVIPPASGSYYVLASLFDMLQGGSGGIRFAWISRPDAAVPGEHNVAGDGSAFLASIAVALMSRYVLPFPTEDATQVTTDDVDDWYSKKNTADLYANNGAGWAQFVNTLELAGQDTQWHAFMHNRLRTHIGATTAKTDVTYSHAAGGWTHPELNDATSSLGRLYHKRDIGTVVYENPKLIVMGGRLRGTTDSTECARMSLNAADTMYWNGMVMAASLDGSDIGSGRCALLHWMYPRDERQQARRYAMSGRNQYVEMLDGDNGSSSNPQTGVVLRNGLRIKLTMPAAKTARVIERYGVTRSHGAFYKAGELSVYPTRPLILIG